MIAAQKGHHECLSILLAHGAEVDKATGVSVRGVCSIAYLWEVACIVLKGCVVTFLSLCRQLQSGLTALMMAALEGHHEYLPILLAHGAEANKARTVSVRGVSSITYLWDVACI